MTLLATARKLKAEGVLGMNRRNVAYIGRYNARERYPLVDNKLSTKKIAARWGLMVPELLGVVETQHEIEKIAEQLATLDQFVIKPAHGSGGKGILVIVGKTDDAYIKSSGERIGLIAVKRHLSNVISGLHSLGGQTDVAIVEALVRVDPMFSMLSHEGVPDIRLIVFKGYPVMGMLRLATRKSDGKANLHQGAVGVGLDIGSGRSICAVINNHVVTHHPDTGVALDDVAIPNWQRLLTLAAQCYEVTQLGYLGCDIVIDEERGPLMLELNARPGLSIQIASNMGLLPRLQHIEDLDVLSATVEDRVRYAMTEFTDASLAEQVELFDDEDTPTPASSG